MTESTCINCNTSITFNPRQSNGKYCSNACQMQYQYNDYINKWKHGLVDGARGYQLSKHVSRYIWDKYNNKCAVCEWCETNPYTHTIPLEIDHIDGNYLNNIESNLILLCPRCHSLTKTYKGANRGNGRHKRRQRYKDGKSY